MKVVILAGGLGTRLAEETHLRPKPMIEIGGRPILWHLMKIYSEYGLNDFIICCGYRGYMIKEYFANYFLHMSDVTINMSDNSVHIHKEHAEPWKVTLVDTGDDTMTGGRLKRVSSYLDSTESFCFTYGDGLADIDMPAHLAFHEAHDRLATVLAVRPPGRYGALQLDGERVTGFIEKPPGDGGFINGGFFILRPGCIEHIPGDESTWEADVLEELALRDQVRAFVHEGFWQPMDTIRDRNRLETLWQQAEAPWKVW